MPTAQDIQASSRHGIEVSDQVIRDLKLPLFTWALELQDVLFAIADDLGIGDFARNYVYNLRTGVYAGALLANFGGAAAASAAASLGGFAALGALGAVAAGVLALFGGDDAEELAEHKKKQAKRTLSRLLYVRYDLRDFADEQNSAMDCASRAAKPFLESDEDWEQRCKLRELFLRADQTLASGPKALFVALSNLARWKAAQEAIHGQSAKTRQTINALAGLDVDKYLSWRIGQEEARIGSLDKNARFQASLRWSSQLRDVRASQSQPTRASFWIALGLAAYAASRILTRR